MSRPTLRISASVVVCSVALTLSACGGIPGNAVVQVGGMSITKDAFKHWLSVAAASSSAAVPGQTAPKPVVPDPPSYTACIAHLQAIAPKPAKGQAAPTPAALKAQCEQQYTALKQQVLGYLISSDWVIGEASDQGVSVSDAEVKKQFNQVKQQQFPQEATFQKFLASSGQTVSDLLLRVKLSQLSMKIQQKVSKKAVKKVTQAEVAAYYSQNQQRFGQPERRNLLLILTKTQAQAEKAKAEVQSGKSFSSVAKRVSIDRVSKASGGSLPGVVKGQEEKALDSAVFSAKPNVLTGPVKTPFGYYVFEVKKILAASLQALAQVQSSIQQQLAAQQQQKALSSFIATFRKKWTAETDCRPEYVVINCKQYKAPKVPTGAPSTGAAAPQTGTPTTSTPSGSTSPPTK